MQRGCLKKSGYIGDLEGFHKSFLRSCVGVRKSVHESVLMLELNRQPIVFSALKQVMGFAERVWRRDDGDVVKTALVESFDLAQNGVRKCWVAPLLGCLRAHGMEECVVGDVCGGECAVMDRVIEEWRQALVPYALPDAVRAVPDGDRKGFNLKKYMKWFYAGSTVDDDGHHDVKARRESDTFWHNLSRRKDIAIVARFRMCSHNLNVESQKFSGHVIGRSLRVCQCCLSGEVEDEMHLALACENYVHLRVNHHDYMRLFINDQLNVFHGPYLNLGDDAKMNALVNPCERPAAVFWRQWAGFLHACEAARADRLSNMSNVVV